MKKKPCDDTCSPEREKKQVFLTRARYVFLCVLMCFTSLSLMAQEKEKKFDVSFENESLETVLTSLKKQCGYDFIYQKEAVAGVKVDQLEMKQATLKQILDKLLLPLGFSYEIVDRSVVIKRNGNVSTNSIVRAMMVIRGKVVDVKKQPIPGATILIKGMNLGTVTDENGEFELSIPSENVELIVSFVGMETRTLKCSERPRDKEWVIILEEDVQSVDEVVVTGMFTRRKESFTGAASTFTQADIARAGNQNLIKSLSNLDPSFRIMENLEFGSDPNRMPDIQLRGQTSFPNLQGDYTGNPNQPLFILDGFETTLEKVWDLDMNRVASITILKDAAAKAIYGAKAGNGVVVIETIRPKSGELRVSYSGDIGLEVPDLTGYDLMNAAEKFAYEVKLGMYSPNTSPEHITAYFSYKKVWDDIQRGVDTYWLSQPLHVGVSHKHSLVLEGGDSRMRYLVGLSYNSVAGVMKGSDRNVLNLNSTLSYTYNDLIFRNTIEITRNWSHNSPYGTFDEYTSLNPYWAPYDENGKLNEVFVVHCGLSDDQYSEIYNPLYNATLNTKNDSYYTEIRDNFAVDWKISEALRAVGSFSYLRQENGADEFYPASHTMFAEYDENGMSDRKGLYHKTTGFSESVNTQVGLNFNKILEKHLIFANLTWNMSTSSSKSTTFSAEGFGNDFMDDISFATQYETYGKPTGSNSKTREVGVILALNYAYDDRYLFDASLRKSASSIYGSDNRWGIFWSLGLGWNLHNEHFLHGNEWIRNFKLRTSVGYTGTQNSDPAQSRGRYEYSSYSYDDRIGAQLMAIPNSKLKWQRNLDWNIGLDITLKRFLTLRVDYYIQNTDDLLSDISLPPSTGFSTYKENLGKIENRGYEIGLQLTPWQNDKQRAYVSFSVNAFHNESKVKKIYDIFENSNREQNTFKNEDVLSAIEGLEGTWTDKENNEVLLNQYTKPSTLYYEGCSMTAIWGMQSLGIDPISGEEMYLTKEGEKTYTWSSADQIVVGDTEPKLSGTLALNAGYRGFTFSVNCSYKFGGDLYNSDLIARVENVTGLTNLDRRILDAWQKPGDIAPYRVTHIASTMGLSTDFVPYTRPTSRFVQENNELYISSINIGYDFMDAKWLKKCSLERLKISFYMNELLRVSSVDIERGTSYPFARNFSFSLQATF